MRVQIRKYGTHVSRVYDLNNERDRNIVEQLKELYGENNVEVLEAEE